MASNPGEWYEAKRQEAERLEAELAGARAVLDAVREARARGTSLVEAAILVERDLRRRLEQARYVGD